jgi:hypothetical protein
MPAQRALVRSELTRCPWDDAKKKLRQVGLRPTKQRKALALILFTKGDRHVTAEMLYEEAKQAQSPCRSQPSITHCTSSPMPAFCVRSRRRL